MADGQWRRQSITKMATRIERFRYLVAAWTILEGLLFGGLLFGWASFVFVLKDEGIYSFLCEQNVNCSEYTSNQERIPDACSNRSSSTTLTIKDIAGNGTVIDYHLSTNKSSMQWMSTLPRTCAEQDAVLNLWFTIAISVMSIMTSVIGLILYRYGPRKLRLFGTLTFVLGALTFAFVDNRAPWLICPGLFCISFGAVCHNAANLQVIPFLFRRGSSIVVSLIMGFYYSAVLLQWLVKVAYEQGIPRRYSYLFITGLHLIMVTTNTLIFFPSHTLAHPKVLETITVISVEDTLDENSKNDDVQECEMSLFPTKDEKNDGDSEPTTEEYTSIPATNDIPSLKSCVFSSTFLLHLVWFVINDFHLLTFIGLSNHWLSSSLDNDKSLVSHFTNAFSFALMCAAILSFIGGLIYDWQRMHFRKRRSVKQRGLLSGVVPVTMATVLGVITAGLKCIDSLDIFYAAFIIFTAYMQFIFAVTFSFLVDVFPARYFGVFYGILFTMAGLFVFFQYGIFTWTEAYPGAALHVNIFMLCLVMLSFANPINLFVQANRETKDYLNRTRKCNMLETTK